MNWARTVKLAELLLKTLQSQSVPDQIVKKEPPMNDPTTIDVAPAPNDPAPASPDAQPVTPQPAADSDDPVATATTTPAAGTSTSTNSADTLAIMQNAVQLAQFLSQNKDVLAFMSALLGAQSHSNTNG